MAANWFRYSLCLNATNSGQVRARIGALAPLPALIALGLDTQLGDTESVTDLKIFSNQLRLDIHSEGGINFRLLRASKQLGVEFIKVEAHCSTLDAEHESYFYHGRRPPPQELDGLLDRFLPQDKLETLIRHRDYLSLRALLQQGLNPNTPVGDEPLAHYAVLQGDVPLLQLLLEYGADPSLCNNAGLDVMAQIFTLADKKLTAAIELLLNHGWPKEAELPDGGSLLWHAFALDQQLASSMRARGYPYIRPPDAYQQGSTDQLIKRAIAHHDQPVLERLLAPLMLTHDQLMVLAGLCSQVDNLVGFKYLESLGLSLDGHSYDMVELLQGAASSASFRLVAYLLLKAEALNLNIDDCCADLVEYLAGDDRSSRLIAILMRRLRHFDHNRAIGTAIEHNALNNLSILLKANKPTHYQYPLLHDHLDALTPQAARMLLAAGENPAETNFDGETVFEAVLRARPNDRQLHQVFRERLFALPVQDYIWLLIALKDTEAFEESLPLVGNNDLQNHQGDSLLMYACRHGAKEIASLLLNHDAELHHKNQDGNSALALAVQLGEREICQELLQAGACATDLLSAPKPKRGRNQRSIEVLLGPLSRLKYEAENLRSPLAPAGRQSLLNWAVYLGDPQLVDLLLSHGADIDAQSHDGNSALYVAVANGNIELLKLLLLRGADPEQWHQGNSLLHTACYRGHGQLVNLLLTAGLELDAANDSEGDTPLHLAAAMGAMHQVDLLPELIEAGANINAINHLGRTPLMNAVRMLNHKGVVYLINAGADISALDNQGLSAFDHYRAIGIPAPGLDETQLKPTGWWVKLHKLTLAAAHVSKWYLLPGLGALALVWQFAPDWLDVGAASLLIWWLISLLLGLRQQPRHKVRPPSLLSPLGNFSHDEAEIRFMATWDDSKADVPLNGQNDQAANAANEVDAIAGVDGAPPPDRHQPLSRRAS